MKFHLTTRDRIRAQLKTSGRSLSWLAEASGVPAGTVSEYLAGKIDTGSEKADRMLSALLTGAARPRMVRR